jgi:hypothetical protein
MFRLDHLRADKQEMLLRDLDGPHVPPFRCDHDAVAHHEVLAPLLAVAHRGVVVVHRTHALVVIGQAAFVFGFLQCGGGAVAGQQRRNGRSGRTAATATAAAAVRRRLQFACHQRIGIDTGVVCISFSLLDDCGLQ